MTDFPSFHDETDARIVYVREVKTADLPEGASIAPESRIGAVQSRQDETVVTAPYGGTIVEWLVEDGDLVSPGQPLLRLHPEGTA